jgi:hypothetical protein
MKNLTSVTLGIVLIMLTAFAFAQPALPDLKVEIGPVSIVSTKYPAIYAGTPDTYRLVPGDVIDIRVGVSNNGQASAGPFTLELRMIGLYGAKSKTFTKKYMDLKPGEKDHYYQQIHIETPDGHIGFQAQIVSMEKEDWNAGDNYLDTGTIIVWQKQYVDEYLKPDLEIKLTSPDTSRHLARTVRIEAVVTNVGNAASPATEIVLKCKEKETKKLSVPPLKPRTSFRHEFQHKWHTLGNKNCRAEVNRPMAFRELSELNNWADLSVHIK